MYIYINIIIFKAQTAIYIWVIVWTPLIHCVGCGGGSGGGGEHPASAPLKLEKMWLFGVKSWFFRRNTPTFFAPPSARRNFFKCAPPNLKSWIRPWTPSLSYNWTNSVVIKNTLILNIRGARAGCAAPWIRLWCFASMWKTLAWQHQLIKEISELLHRFK
jgi:hypothetical protein